jgi:uncharacterized small protein (DUF1192 family)
MTSRIPVQVNTDNHIQGDEALTDWAQQELSQRLARFREQITRVEVHFSDLNATRGGALDKRCMLEARLAGRQPLAVSHEAHKVADALSGASDKLLRALDTALGRARDAQGRESIRGSAG